MKTNFQKLMTGITSASFVSSILIGIASVKGHASPWLALGLLVLGLISFPFSED